MSNCLLNGCELRGEAEVDNTSSRFHFNYKLEGKFYVQNRSNFVIFLFPHMLLSYVQCIVYKVNFKVEMNCRRKLKKNWRVFNSLSHKRFQSKTRKLHCDCHIDWFLVCLEWQKKNAVPHKLTTSLLPQSRLTQAEKAAHGTIVHLKIIILRNSRKQSFKFWNIFFRADLFLVSCFTHPVTNLTDRITVQKKKLRKTSL